MYIREIVISGRHKKKKDWIVSRKHKIGSKDRRDLKNWPSKAKNLEESDFDVKPSLAPPKSAENSEIVFFSDFFCAIFFFGANFFFPAFQNFSVRPTAVGRTSDSRPTAVGRPGKKNWRRKRKCEFFSGKNVFRNFRQILEELGLVWRQNQIPRDFLL